MEFFESIWVLLQPQGEYKRRRQACIRLWQSYSAPLQQRIYQAISEAKRQGKFVNTNPYFAIEDTALRLGKAAQPQVLSFDEYYKKYGTTEDRDGWKRVFLEEEKKTIYVKS